MSLVLPLGTLWLQNFPGNVFEGIQTVCSHPCWSLVEPEVCAGATLPSMANALSCTTQLLIVVKPLGGCDDVQTIPLCICWFDMGVANAEQLNK